MKAILITLTGILLGQFLLVSCEKEEYMLEVKYINKSNDVVNMYIDKVESTQKISKNNEVVPGSFYIDVYTFPWLVEQMWNYTCVINICKNGQLISSRQISRPRGVVMHVIWDNNTISTYVSNNYVDNCK